MWQYRGVDPRVAEVILRSKRPRHDSPQRVALAAALCPEILAEKKVWTHNPTSIVEAEKIGQECGRSMNQIKTAVASWVETSEWRSDGYGGVAVPGIALKALLNWDRSLAVWVAAQLAQSVAHFAHEDSAPDARTDARWRVDILIKAAKEWVRTGSRKPTPAENNEMTQMFVPGMLAANDIIYYGGDRRMTERERDSMTSSGLALRIAVSTVGMVFQRNEIEKDRSVFDVTSTSRTLLKESVDTFLGRMAEGVITYPRHYTGESGALFGSSASIVPAALVGAFLGAGAMHWSKR